MHQDTSLRPLTSKLSNIPCNTSRVLLNRKESAYRSVTKTLWRVRNLGDFKVKRFYWSTEKRAEQRLHSTVGKKSLGWGYIALKQNKTNKESKFTVLLYKRKAPEVGLALKADNEL
jgi:hypothetical protein